LAQDAKTLLAASDSALTSSDSLSIFRLLDSLILLNEQAASSQLAVRLAYNSNVLYAGRTLGIDQFGLSPGISYYHKSGLFADVSSYISKDLDPSYYLTVLSAGYMHLFSRILSGIVSYDRYMYNLADEYVPYPNALTASPYLDLNFVNVRFDYSYYFGEKHAHRMTPTLGINLTRKKLFGIDRVSFRPSAGLLMGTETLSEIEVRFPQNFREYIDNQQKYGTPYRLVIRNYDVFGIMNYSFTAPIYITHRNWNFTLSYTYNIPKALPDEPLYLSKAGYVAASVTYFIDQKKKSPLQTP
jgi:hypothetical protein